MRGLSAVAAFAALWALSGASFADEEASQLSRTETKAAIGVTQTSSLADGSMHLDLTKGYVYVPPQDVPPILSTLKARAPAAQSLGAVAPAGKKAGAADYWIAVIGYDPVGHVPETGADELGAITFIDSVKAARPVEPGLQSFAVAPTYDPVSKTLVWGEQYEGAAATNSLRHETRVLGRSGVGGVTIIARPAQLAKVQEEAKAVRAMIAFNDGQRYADFSAATDRASQYNLPGLIDGKVRAEATTEPATTTSESFAFADVLPGGRFGWASFLAGGLLLLVIIGSIGRAFARGSRSDDTSA